MSTRLIIHSLLAAAVVVSLVAGCGDDGGTPDAPDGGSADAAVDAPIPQLGVWRGRFQGTFSACEIGFPGKSLALAEQMVFQITSATETELGVVGRKGEPITSGCIATGPGTFDCPGASTHTGDDGNTYSISGTVSFSFTSATAGEVSSSTSVTCTGNTCASSDPCVDDATYTLEPFEATEVLQPIDCADEATLVPGLSSVQTYIDFVNDSNEPIIRHWIDWSGNRLAYPAIAPGATERQSTATNHYWVVMKGTTCMGIYTPTADIGVVTIQ